MSIFFFICALFLFPIGLVTGLIRPSLFNKLFHGNATRKKTSILFGVAILISLILSISTTPKTETLSTQEQIDALRAKHPQSAVVVATSTPETTTPAPQPSVSQKPKATPEELIRSILQSTVTNYGGNTNFAYQSVEFEKADTDRPSGTKMVTVKINVGSVYNKSVLLKDSGKLSSQVFQSVFPSSLNAYDVYVWYMGETTDRYGNKKNEAILTYAMDKKTYEKINWQNFDVKSLCDFLVKEEKLVGFATGPACNMLVNMQ